ncbi:MAG: phosphatase PAP2 family protein [Acidimicrobiales bacterium]
MDAALYRSVNRFAARTHWAHSSFVAMAKYGIVLFALALVVGWLSARHADSSDGVIVVIWSGAAALIALGIGQVIGNAVDRARPYTAMPASHVLIARSADFSFPSDHATAAGAVAVGLLFAGRRYGSSMLGLVTGCLALLLAVSRVYAGVHYPGDVVAGLALGAAVAAAGVPLALWLLRPVVRWLDHTPARALVGRHSSVSPSL